MVKTNMEAAAVSEEVKSEKDTPVSQVHAVMEGITDALYGEFKDSCGIYKEGAAENVKSPAFFVQCEKPAVEKQLGSRIKMNLLFAVKYFPGSAEPKQEINDVFCRLAGCLGLIAVDKKMVRGVVECREIVNDTLDATAEYTLFLTKKEEQICMEELQMKQEVENG